MGIIDLVVLQNYQIPYIRNRRGESALQNRKRMLGSIKLLVALVLLLGGLASIYIGYKQWAWVMRMIFGKERVQAQGTKMIAFYMYIGGAALILLAILVAV